MVAHNCHGKTKNLTHLKAKPKISRQKQKPHGKTKNLTAKQNTSRQNQILHSKNKIALVLPWVFAFVVRYLVFAVKYLVCREVFGFAVRFLFLPWGFRFCREVFCFCREDFGFAVTVVGHRTSTVIDVVPRTRKLWQDVGHVTYLSLLRGWEVGVSDPQTDSRESTKTKI